MFDRFTIQRPRRRSRLAVILSVSFMVHSGIALALVIAGMWQVDKLMLPRRQVSLAVMAGPPRIDVDEPPPRPPDVKPDRNKVRKVERLKEMVQPVEDQQALDDLDDDEDIEYVTGAVDAGYHGDGTGKGGTSGGQWGFGDGAGPGIPIVEVPTIEALPEPPEQIPTNIPAEFLDGRRIAGNERIMPPESVRASMDRRGQDQLSGVVKMCLGTDGKVTRLQTIETTGYGAYDNKLLGEMKFWRYRPYRVNGEPIPVCAPITFIFVLTH